MADNENILVLFDYNNIFVVDPNRVLDSQNTPRDRYLKQEELAMYANLTCKVFPRTKLVLGQKGELQQVRETTVAEINFLNPEGKKFLDTSWTEFTSQKNQTANESSVNQLFKLNDIVSNNLNPDYVNRDAPLLGIVMISVKLGTGKIAEVSIEMEDIRGRALFEQGENSPYAAFFNMPRPIFTLTIKGYLGMPMKYELQLHEFHARFVGQTGNFTITTTYFPFKFSIFSELSSDILFTTPYMYKTTYQIGQQSNQPNGTQAALNQTNQASTTNAITITSSKGRQKITEVYNEYKSKGIIDDNFPDITFSQFLEKLENIEKNIEDNFSKVDLSILSDLDQYYQNFTELVKKFEINNDCWLKKWVDLESYYILKKNSEYPGGKVYPLKKENSNSQSAENAKGDLTQLFMEYNKKLNGNPTCGSSGKYTIGGKTEQSPIEVNFSYEKVEIQLKKEDIDWEETYAVQTKKNGKDPNNPAELSKFTEEVSKSIFNTNFVEKDGKVQPKTYFYSLDSKGGYYEQKANLQKNFDRIKQQIEDALSKQLLEKIQDPNRNGLGFSPTVRNIFAVFMSTVEAYLRLLDDVHHAAWEKRNEDIRRSAISTFSPDYLANKINTTDFPVFPWPTYVVETTEKNNTYQNRYPGEPEYINQTQGYRYDMWPEVEFVEEYIRSVIEIDESKPDSVQPSNELQYPLRVSLNAIDYPITNQVYFNYQTTKYFYEIWERVFLAAFYQRLNRGSNNPEELFDVIAGYETDNILTSLNTTNPNLLNILKNYKFDAQNIEGVLRHYSNDGTGESWQLFIRTLFTTPYIKNRVQNDFAIYNNAEISDIETFPAKNVKNIDKVKRYLKSSASNELEFTDTYPFTHNKWLKTNVQLGSGISKVPFNDTSKVITFNNEKQLITNYELTTGERQKRPITNFNYISPSSYNTSVLSTYYTDLKISDQYPTQGTLTYSQYSAELIAKQSTSILNTPYFVNSILSGVTKFQQRQSYPFANSAFLFLNSLPLITLREKYKSYEGGAVKQLDYIAATIRKFGALHKLPYAWILKLGSVWWRYKTWIESNKTTDPILSDWLSFNQNFNYDPINQNPAKSYTLTLTDPLGNASTTLINMQRDGINANLDRNTTMCSGLYPAVINEFNLFLQGTYLINFTYTSADIQSAIDNRGLYIIPGTNKSNIYHGYFSNFDILFTATTYNRRSLSYRTFSTYVEDFNDNLNVFLLPSFGSNVNQAEQECFSRYDSYHTMTTEIFGNQSVFDGSVRCFWNAPHFGYFDNQKINIPQPNEYFKQIYVNQDDQENFSLVFSGYTDISEIFGVFRKDELDLFEAEFLKFSQSVYDYIPEEGLSDVDKTYYNFQLLIRELMNVPKPTSENYESIIDELQQNQLVKICDIILGFLEHDVLLKSANPTNFERRIFYSLSDRPMEDRFTYSPYFAANPNALPHSGSTTTLSQSIINYPEEWKTLELYVGFSTINELSYKNTGSYITDFFVDMNIEFTVNNIIAFQDVIKIYATQKLIDPTLNKATFLEKLNEYLTKNETFRDDILNSLFTKLQTQIPEVKIIPANVVPATDSTVSRMDVYYSTQAINDKWIAGYDVSYKTFMEDILFLDAANRDIGNVVLLDIYNLAKTKKFYRGQKTIQNIIGGMVNELKMNPTIVPGYVNYYGINEVVKNPSPSPYGTLELANVLFGTHLNVDLSLSQGVKYIFQLPENNSNNLNTTNNQNVYYEDDSFQLSKENNNAVEDMNGKKDWAFSNRVIGFDVNFGTQGQNVFTNLSIDMNQGKATYASMLATMGMVEKDYKKTASQNISLYNYYSKMSYQCELNMLGCAMVQPQMWFVLRNVPMFSGSYKITEVHHRISPGVFDTKVVGVRQKSYSFPTKYDYLQTINKNLLERIKTKLPKSQSTQNTPANNVIAQKNNKTADVQNQKKPVDTQDCLPVTPYEKYSAVDKSTLVKSTYNDILSYIDKYANQETSQRETFSKLMFTIVYLESFDGTNLSTYQNNFCGIKLDQNWGSLDGYFEKEKYVCLKGSKDQVSKPYAVFETVEKNIQFLYENIKKRVFLLTGTTNTDLAKFYILYWPRKQEENVYTTMTSSQLEPIEKSCQNAINTWNTLKTIPSPTIQGTIFDVRYGLLLNQEYVLIQIKIKQNVGLWKIVFREVDILEKPDSPKCQSVGFVGDPGDVSNDYQIFDYYEDDLIFDADCETATNEDKKGTIYYTITITADPVKPNGSLDPTRKQYTEKFELSYKLG